MVINNNSIKTKGRLIINKLLSCMNEIISFEIASAPIPPLF